MQPPPTIAILGYKNSGKTMVATHITAHLASTGHRVLACKRVGDPDFTLDRPGTDSQKLAESGASAVLLHSDASTTLLLSRPASSLQQLLELGLTSVGAEVVVMEGFSSWTRSHPRIAKIICIRTATEKEELSKGLAGPLLATCTLKRGIPGTLHLPEQLQELLARVNHWLASTKPT